MKNLSGGSFELLWFACSGQEVNAGRVRNVINFYKSNNIIQIFVTSHGFHSPHTNLQLSISRVAPMRTAMTRR